MQYKFISLLKLGMLITLLSVTSQASAEYYIVYAAPPIQTIHCDNACRCASYQHKQLHHKHSSYSVSVYYGWYTYSSGVWIPSTCDCCIDCQRIYFPETSKYVIISPDEIEYDPSMDTDTADHDLE